MRLKDPGGSVKRSLAMVCPQAGNGFHVESLTIAKAFGLDAATRGAILCAETGRQATLDSTMLDGERYTKRCERWNRAGHAHELTFSCYQGHAFLAKERTCRWLADSINNARHRHEFDLWAYVFMPNHVHLILCPRKAQYSISNILQATKQPVARRAIQYLKTGNPGGLRLLATGQQIRAYEFWQKSGGYDRNIVNVETLIETVRYIHNNPVRKGLVETPEQWPYSSAADWDRVGCGPIPIDHDSFPAH